MKTWVKVILIVIAVIVVFFVESCLLFGREIELLLHHLGAALHHLGDFLLGERAMMSSTSIVLSHRCKRADDEGEN